MSTWLLVLIVFAAVGIGLWLVSFLIEAVRPAPAAPQALRWAPDIPVEYVDLGGVRVRYIKIGAGPNLVLLHTLRTQLDLFEKIVPGLAKHFTVFAFDYPGHGWSDIPGADYAPEDFYRWTAALLDKLDIAQAAVTGVSIGGTIGLVLAARQNPRVGRVIAVNPYDCPPAGSIRRSSLTARLVLTFSGVPLVGATMMRLRNRLLTDRILAGGVAAPRALPKALAKEFNDVGARPGHYRAFLNLLAHERQWNDALREYPRIGVPVLLIYGEKDWAPPAERERARALIPGAKLEIVLDGGHFLSLDRAPVLEQLIVRFASR